MGNAVTGPIQALPVTVAQGGTGSTTAGAALTALGGLPTTGGTITSTLTVNGTLAAAAAATVGTTLSTGSTLTVTAGGVQVTGASGFASVLASNGGTDSHAGAAVVTPANSNGTAAQLTDTTRDYMLYLTVGTAGTAFVLAMGPTAGVANTIIPSSAATSGDVYSFRLPASWFWKWSATTATLAQQTAIGC